MLKRILFGSGALGVLAATYLLGSVSLGGAFAQTAPAAGQQQQVETGEQAESAALASQAKISADQANAAALGKFPGATVKKTELDNENGKVIYSVQLTDSAGTGQDVKVDATTGTVVSSEADGPEGPDTPGGAETGETQD
jgi:uncharacterized membrane protein YkoI